MRLRRACGCHADVVRRMACFSIPIAAPLFNSSPSSTPIAATGVLLILSLRPIAHGSLLSTCSAPSACLIAVNGAECFYAYYFCGELVKTAPADVIISNRQLNQYPCLVSSISPSVVSCGRGGYFLLCGVSFPVIFVLFRCVPELSISSGIMRLCCDFLLACRAGGVIVFAFLSITLLGFQVARAVSARVMSSAMSSVSAGCLLPALRCLPSSSLRLSLFAPRRLAPRPALRVVGRGADGDACLPRDVVARGVALASWSCLGCGAVPWFILSCLCRPSRPTASDEMATGDGNSSDVIRREAAACPMRGWRRGA